MRLFILPFLLLSFSLALANQPYELGSRHIPRIGPYQTDDLAYSQAYSFDLLLNGYSNYSAGARWCCDDFVITGGWDFLYRIDFWMIWTGEQATMINLVISEDANSDSDPNTNTDFWSESVECTNYFTGDSNWGYDIYQTACYFPSGSTLLEHEFHYYLEVQADVSDNCYILVSHNYIGDYCWYNDGSGVWVRSDVAFGEDSDMFFNLYMTPA